MRYLAIAALALLGQCSPTEAPAPVPCILEDGSSAGQVFPCYWDASERGNGRGVDFIIPEVGAEPFHG